MKMAYFAALTQGNTYNVGGFMFRSGIEIPISEQMYRVLRGNPQFKCRSQEISDLSPEALGIPKVTSNKGMIKKEKPKEVSKENKKDSGEEESKDTKTTEEVKETPTPRRRRRTTSNDNA